jgi:hypothetical protein
MTESLVSDETPIDFFRCRLTQAMEHQRVSTSALTEHYLVSLLVEAVEAAADARGIEEAPLSLLYVRALQASGRERQLLLRGLGDSALFISGFFADSLERRRVEPGYYRALGGRAYGQLGQEEGLGPHVFSELGRRFLAFADLFAEVSETSRLTSQTSVVRLYERWRRTGSPRAARLLARRGIVPSTTDGGVH